MSYCRWSSDNFKSDVYVYANVSGYWTIHVAGSRFEKDLPSIDLTDEESFLRTHKEQQKAIVETKHVPIGLPYDGKTFDLETPGECADKLLELKKLGYYVPQHAIDSLRDESIQEAKGS